MLGQTKGVMRDMAVEVAGKLAVKAVDTVAYKLRKKGSNAPTNEELSKLEIEIQTHQATIAELEKENEDLYTKNDTLLTEINRLEDESENYRLKYEKMKLICIITVVVFAVTVALLTMV